MLSQALRGVSGWLDVIEEAERKGKLILYHNGSGFVVAGKILQNLTSQFDLSRMGLSCFI